jgi:outer membrane lipoprotein-sorting protein
MSRWFATLFVLVPAFLNSTPQQPELSVDQIIERHVAALGGMDKLRAIQNMTMTGTASMMNGHVEVPLTIRVKRPAYMRMDMTMQGQTFVQAFDGNTAWMLNPLSGSPDPQQANEEDAKSARDDADFIDGSLVDYRAKGNSVDLAGIEDVDGAPAYKLKVTRKSGSVQDVYLDAKTFLPIKTTSTRKQHDNEVAYESFPGNYKPVNGVMMPFSLSQKMNGHSMMELTIDKAEVNTPMDASIFQIPEVSAPKK